MSDQLQEFDAPLQIEQLSFRRTAIEVAVAIAITLGLAALWLLENVRDAFFGLLDRIGVKGRPHQANAFPPGRPRKLRQPH